MMALEGVLYSLIGSATLNGLDPELLIERRGAIEDFINYGQIVICIMQPRSAASQSLGRQTERGYAPASRRRSA